MSGVRHSKEAAECKEGGENTGDASVVLAARQFFSRLMANR